MKSLISTFLLVSFLGVNLFAQDTEHEEKKHLITGALGYTYIPQGASEHSDAADGVFIPSIGLDYFYSISHRWEIGIMTDLELGEYLVFDKDLNRKNALVVAGIAAFALTKHINVFAGGGMEFEKEHNLAVIRVGTEYAFNLKKEWIIAPGIFFDFKEGIDTWSLSVAFGKEF
ncbi:MAG: hypothetical protein L3J54_13925 [Draconibacterium sp.]|nr:hypothetical protein [Draconibacterium sp.]